MGAWYRVIKTIKGHRYVYEQRTRREGTHVRTENRYVARRKVALRARVLQATATG